MAGKQALVLDVIMPHEQQQSENLSPIKIGISTCLLGEPLSYDGGHMLDTFLRDKLGQWVEYVPVCPEVLSGMGVPREPMILAGAQSSPRLINRRTGKDMTDRMLDWSGRKLKKLESENLCGFIFKGGSQSCGMERVKVYNDKGTYGKTGVGIFAKSFMTHFPTIPTEEEGRLQDEVLRENFIERIFVFKRWREFIQGDHSRGGLVEFHTRNKLLILSHSSTHYTELGRLIASQKDYSFDEVTSRYQKIIMKALSLQATVKKNTNVLIKIMGYFKKVIEPEEKLELLEIIENYKGGAIPLIVPITIFRHYVNKFRQPYLSAQTYLQPHPIELQLRNHA